MENVSLRNDLNIYVAHAVDFYHFYTLVTTLSWSTYLDRLYFTASLYFCTASLTRELSFHPIPLCFQYLKDLVTLLTMPPFPQQLPLPPNSNVDSLSACREGLLRTADTYQSSPSCTSSSFAFGGWTNERKRIGAPPLLRLPLSNYPFPKSPLKRNFKDMKQDVVKILHRYKIHFKSIDLVVRCDKYHSVGYWTVLVYAKADRDYARKWPSAVNGMRMLLIDRNLGQRNLMTPIYVEIIDPDLEAVYNAHPVEPNELLARNWNDILSHIVRPVLDYPPFETQYYAISASRYGPYRQGDRRNKPTIIVSVPRDRPYCEWRQAEEYINHMLVQQGFTAEEVTCYFVGSDPPWTPGFVGQWNNGWLGLPAQPVML